MKKTSICLIGCLVICLAITVGCSGCGDIDVATSRLSIEQEKLAAAYLNGIIAEQIKLNPDHRAWSCGPGKIFLAGNDGVEIFNRVPDDKNLYEYAVARFYSAQELELQLLGISCGKVAPYKHEKYTFRSYLKLSVSEKRRMWQHIPAASVGVVGIKGIHKVDELKTLLKNIAGSNLPEVIYDYRFLYRSDDKAAVRSYEVLCFVCYDPDQPGWVLEEAAAEADTPEEAFWIQQELKLPEKVEEYNRRLFWKDSLFIRKNYDQGLVLYQGKWMKAEIAEKCRQLAELVKNFNSSSCTLDELVEFLSACAAFPAECDRKEVWGKAHKALENLIAAWQNNGRDLVLNLKELQRMRSLLSNSALFTQFRNMLDPCNNAIKNLINTYNSAIEEKITALTNVRDEVSKLFKSANERDQKMRIVLERQRVIWQKIAPLDSRSLNIEVRKMIFYRALLEEKIKNPKMFSQYIRRTPELEKIVPDILYNCEVCRKGRVRCEYCQDLSGKCRQCRGEKFVRNDFCSLCRGSGNCDTCHGVMYRNCLSCKGRGFFIRKKAIKLLQQKAFDEFAMILKNQKNRLSVQKLRDE